MRQGVVGIATTYIRMDAGEPDLADALVFGVAYTILIRLRGHLSPFVPEHRMKCCSLVVERQRVTCSSHILA